MFLRRIPSTKSILAIAITSLVMGGILFWSTDNPFSWSFAVGLAAMALGLFGLLASPAVALARSKRAALRIIGYSGGAVLMAGVILLGVGVATYERILFPPLNASKWQADLTALSQLIVTNHPAPFSSTPRASIDAFVAGTRKLIPNQTPARIVMAFTQLVALLHDGHSTLFPFQPASGFRMYPVQATLFSDGLYVTDAAAKYANLIGDRIVSIENVPISAAFARMAPFVGADNPATIGDRIPFYLLCPDALHAIGLISDSGHARFVLANDKGHALQVVLEPAALLSFLYWYFEPLEPWKFHPNQSGFPLYRQREWENYWFTSNPWKHVLFFEFRQIRDQGSETIPEFSRRLIEFAESHDVQRFVIDLRQNSGGDNTLVLDFVDRLSRSKRLNRPGHLFALIGPHTFSAAVNLTSMLENRTEAIFIGGPTGAGPNHFGDTRRYTLPNSKLWVFISSRREQFGDVADARTAYMPDIQASFSHNDYFSGRDPGLDAAMSYRPTPLPPTSSRQTEPYLGRYAYDSDRVVNVSLVDNNLEFDIADFMHQLLRPAAGGQDRFTTRKGGPELEFVRDPNNRITALDWIIGDSRRRLSRLQKDVFTPHELLVRGELARSLAAYRSLRRRNPGDYAVTEDRLAHWGYERMRAGNSRQALAMFALAAEFYPGSSIAHERLADAQAAGGHAADAIRHYKLAIQLDPSNDDARRALSKLGG